MRLLAELPLRRWKSWVSSRQACILGEAMKVFFHLVARRLALILAVAASVGTSPGVSAQESAGRLIMAQGDVRVARSEDGPWSVATAGVTLAEGEFVATGKGARAALLLSDQTQVQLHGESVFQIKRVRSFTRGIVQAASRRVLHKAMGNLYRLLRGRIWIRAMHIVDCEAGSALVGVRGTDLGVSLDVPSQETTVWVLWGRVQVLHPLGNVLLASMEVARMSPTSAPQKESIRLHPAQTVQWVLRHPAWVSSRDVILEGRLRWPQELLPAVRARDRGQPHMALELLRTDGQGPLRELLRGWILLDQGRLDDARAVFSSGSRSFALNWAGWAISLLTAGRSGEAREKTLEAIAHCGEDPLLIWLLAVCALGVGEVEEAAAILGHLSEMAHLDPLLQIQRALMALVWNQPEMAQCFLSQALLDLPDSPTALLVSAALLRSRGDLERALDAAMASLERDPRYLPALVQAAELFWGTDREAQARELMELALEVRPWSSQAFILRGFMHLSKGDAVKATEDLKRALASDPSSSEAHLGLGILGMREGRREEALEEFLTASLVEPMASLPLSYLGKALHDLGRSREGLAVLERAAELDPLDPTPHLYRGLILRDLHRPGEAMEALLSSMARNRNRSVYRSRFLLDQDRAVRNVNLAEIYRELGLLARARSHAIVSVREDPTNNSAHLFLSTPFREEGRSRAGIRELLRAQMLGPANQNTFNTFHDYTIMFEGPKLQGELESGIGEMGLWSGSLFLQGGVGGAAGDLVILADAEEGFHQENHVERNVLARTDWKISVFPSQELLLRLSSMAWVQGDHGGDADSEWVQDPFLHQRGFVRVATLGHRWHLGPSQELLSYGIWSSQGFDMVDRLWSGMAPGLDTRMDLNWKFRQQHTQAGVLRLGRYGEHRWEWGIHGARGTERLDSWVQTSLFHEGTSLGRILRTDRHEVPTASVDLHAGDIWQVAPGMFLEGSLHFQWARAVQSPPATTQGSDDRACVGPRLGMVWQMGGRDVLRGGLARYSEPPYTMMEGLQPVEVAGFPLGEDSARGSLNNEFFLGWDRAWSSQLFSHLGVSLAKRRSWDWPVGARGFQGRDLWDWRARGELELLLSSSLALAGRYRFREGRWEEAEASGNVLPGEGWAEHRGAVELRWVHPAGWRFFLRYTGVLQVGDLGTYGRAQKAFWADLELEKFLWGRRCSARLMVRNLLDQPFRLRTWELVEEKGIPARQVSFWLRFVF